MSGQADFTHSEQRTTEIALKNYERQSMRQLTFVRLGLSGLALLGYFLTSQNDQITVVMLLLCSISGFYALRQLKLRRSIQKIGLLLALNDGIVLALIPWNYFIATPGAPATFLLKNDEAIFALLACAVYALLLRPLYPLIIGGISAISHVVYYFVAAHFGDLIVTKSWILARTTEAVQLEGYFFNHLLIVPAGALLMARLTRNGRELILRSGASEYRNAQLARYFSPALANRLGEGIPVERGGEVREIAVLFQDLQGFTKISEQLGASATVALLAEIHDEMVETIFAEEGILDKYLGDGLMACFGSIGESRDIAGRAVRSALAMRTALAQINQVRSARGESILHQRIGIHVGPAVVGNIGSSARLEFTAIGDTVNTAARVEAYAKQVNTDILLTGATVEQLEDRAVVQSLGAVQLRGKDRSTEIYALETWREVDRASEASDE